MIGKRLTESLVQVTEDQFAAMSFANFHMKVVARYSVDINGWPENGPKFGNPSYMTSSLEKLSILYNALESGACHFVKLSEREKDRRVESYLQMIESGELVLCKRKTRSDAGKAKEKRLDREGTPEMQDEIAEVPEPSRKRSRTEDKGTRKMI